MKTAKEVSKKWCRCATYYTTRGVCDPMCQCEIIEEVVEDAHKEQRNAIAANLRERSRGMSDMGKRIMEMTADIVERFGEEE